MKNEFNAGVQSRLAETLRALHHGETPLVLMNAWDSASAKAAEMAGFPAIATTSSGISWSCGYQDGEHIPPATMVEAIGRIARVVHIPVTADIEGGYAHDSLDEFSDIISRIIRAGAVGINLEDTDPRTQTLNDISVQQDLIRTAREAGRKLGVNLFINARTDVMHGTGNPEDQIELVTARAAAFEAAGADGIFVPFVKDIDMIAALKAVIRLPLNILMEDTLDVAALKQLKVNRISTGSKPVLAMLSLLKKMAGELLNANEWHTLFVKDTTYGEMNKWFEA